MSIWGTRGREHQDTTEDARARERGYEQTWLAGSTVEDWLEVDSESNLGFFGFLKDVYWNHRCQ